MAKDFIPLGEVAARDVAMIELRCRSDLYGRLSVQRPLAQYGPDAIVRCIIQDQIGPCPNRDSAHCPHENPWGFSKAAPYASPAAFGLTPPS